MLESAVKAACLRYLKTVPQAFAFSSPVSAYGRAGVSDITAVIQGQAWFIECKTPEAYRKPHHGCSDAQRAFASKVIAAGGIYVVVESLERLRISLRLDEALRQPNTKEGGP